MGNYQSTSGQAYKQAMQGINDSQLKVFRIFANSKKSLCNKQVASILGWTINRVTPRVNELIDKGLLKHHNVRLYSGRNVNFNRLADEGEQPDVREKTWKERALKAEKVLDALTFGEWARDTINIREKLGKEIDKDLKEW